MLPQEIFLNLDTLRLLLRSCLSQNATRISPPVVSTASEAFESSEHFARYIAPPPICAFVQQNIAIAAIEN